MAKEPTTSAEKTVEVVEGASGPLMSSAVVAGNAPDADGSITGTIRFTAVIDAKFLDGELTSIGFGAAQYTVFENSTGHLSVRSSFPKR